MLEASLKEVHAHCGHKEFMKFAKPFGWRGKRQGRTAPISLMEVLETNGLGSAVWALRACVGSERAARLFACALATRVLPIYEEQYPNDKRPGDAIATASLFAHGMATQEDMNKIHQQAGSACWDAAGNTKTGAAFNAVWHTAWAASWCSNASDPASDVFECFERACMAAGAASRAKYQDAMRSLFRFDFKKFADAVKTARFWGRFKKDVEQDFRNICGGERTISEIEWRARYAKHLEKHRFGLKFAMESAAGAEFYPDITPEEAADEDIETMRRECF